MGIIGIPFKKIQGKPLYRPSVVFGTVTEGITKEYSFKGNVGYWSDVIQKEDDIEDIDTIKVVVSNNRLSNE